MKKWIFTSKNLENIERAFERLMWGFWDRDVCKKQRKNWRLFIRSFNNIEPFDVAVFQLKTGEIHAIGIIEKTFYDDQTPIWEKEINENKIYFPWRVSFISMIFSKEPFIKHFIDLQYFIDGYGLGEIPEHEFKRILNSINDSSSFKINIK